MKKGRVFFILSSFIFTACNEHIEDDYKDGMIQHATMYAHNIISEPEDAGGNTRSILTPASDGTHFAWADGDIAAVFSSGNGMTNFNIDATTISSDGTSAEFNGAGFSLKSFSAYYAFYPYSASNLNKNKVYVDYNNQNIQSNGCFKDLGNRDFMWARGATNDKGEVSFDFQHLGCVVDFKLKAPASANYSQVRFELESNVDNAKLIKYGYVDLTSSNPSVVATTSAASDTIMKVNLNSGNGLSVEKDSIIHVYMMMAPQDLSSYKMLIRLVDSNEKWYSACVRGKNMKAGYTYHYTVAEDSKDGGFTGSGTGLPDASSFSLISTYRHEIAVPYYDFLVENKYLYAACETGIRKLDYTEEKFPSPVIENAIANPNLCLMTRSITSKDQYLYVGLRQNSSGEREKLVPEISESFEGNVTSFTNQELTNNPTVNAFFTKFHVLSVDLCKVASMVVCKAYKKTENSYVNAIIFKVSGEKDHIIYSSSHSTRVDALSSLPNYIEKSNGDFCDVDWSTISEGSQTLRMSFNLYTSMTISSKLKTMMTIKDNPCPGYGLNSGLFELDGSSENKAGLLTYTLPNDRTEGEVSFWINVNKGITGSVCMPIYTNASSNVFSVYLKTMNNGFGIGIENSLPDKALMFGKWYNIKVTYEKGKKTIYYREAECGTWNLISTQTTTPKSYNKVSIGISGKNSKVEVYVDEFRYKQYNLDDFSYVKGKIDILDKNDLSVLQTLNLDYKVTGIGVKNDVLVVNCLNAINIYNIHDALNPKLVYTYRPKSFRDIQNVSFFETNGHWYAMSCKYNKGILLFDITDSNNILIVADDEFSDFQYNGKSGVVNSFSAVVDYPYAYLTVSPIPTQLNNMREATGILVIDLSDFGKIRKKMYTIPLEDITLYGNGDPTPTNIAKYGNRLYLNNREKGIAVFKIESPGNISYEGNINVGDACVNCIEITSDGRMFLGDDNGCGDNRNINLIRFE